jgi:hypothetical protein
MSDDRTRILDLLAAGKVTTEEAMRLLDALDSGTPKVGEPEQSISQTAAAHTALPKFIYVKVISEKGDNVNIKIPLSLVRAGLKLTSFIPQPAMEQINKSMGEHGLSMDLLNFKAEDLEELIAALQEMEINVDASNGDNVRVYAA